VRHDEPDEPDDARERNGRRCEQRGSSEDEPLRAREIDADGPREARAQA
jgi:hypothetical protein